MYIFPCPAQTKREVGQVTTILLYGGRTDTAVSFKLCRALERNGGVLHICGGTVLACSLGRPRFLLYETDRLENVQLDDGILICKPTLPPNPGAPSLSDSILCVAEPENTAALAMLRAAHGTVVTCGMSPRDTLTISSIGEQDAVVSVQRAIRLPGGETPLEPCEVRVRLSAPVAGYPLLGTCAVLLLAGCLREGGLLL